MVLSFKEGPYSRRFLAFSLTSVKVAADPEVVRIWTPAVRFGLRLMIIRERNPSKKNVEVPKRMLMNHNLVAGQNEIECLQRRGSWES